MTDPLNDTTLARLAWPLRLTLAGLWAERLARAFWPLWVVALVALTALSFGLQDALPPQAVWAGLAAVAIALAATGLHGLRRFRRPRRADAVARLDATLAGRPLAALADAQALGTDDPASTAVWQAHRARMAARAAAARPVAPDLRLATRDRYGLRFMALSAFLVALLFGSVWRAASVAGLGAGPAEALIAGPSWEGWVQPPRYTGRPTAYLNDVPGGQLTVPVGSRVQIRLYGDAGSLSVAETVSGRPGTDLPPATDPAQGFDIARGGQIEIAGPGGRLWTVVVTPDAAPTIAATAPATREQDGQMRLPYRATDDYGVTGGQAEVVLDMSALDRRYGLAIDPDPRDPLRLDLAIPIRGSRTDFEEAVIEDVSKHPWANLPVTVRLEAGDAAGQTGSSAPMQMILPGRRFFDPLAAAIIELRRDLLWARGNGPRATQVLKAVMHRSDGFIRNERALPRLRAVLARLDAEAARLTPEVRDEIADELWEIALLVEEGDLQNALERLQRAQDRLDEAIRNGADQAEIEQLMQELREALDDYTRELAEQAQRDPNQQQLSQEDMQGLQMNGDQLQEMMDRLQQLMEEGRMAEAAELMEMMRQLMENMRVVQGQGGQGQGQQGNQAMRDLNQTLRDQQDLSDDSFRDLQQGGNGQGQPQPGQPGQDPGQQQGEGGQPQDGQPGEGQGQGGQSLAERQRDLRDRLGQLGRGQLPGDGTEQGEAGRRALDEAGRAMRDAEQALRDGDLPGALDRQADAMEAMREGSRAFGEALAQEQQQQQQGNQPGDGTAMGQQGGTGDPRMAQRDPLGRENGPDGTIIGSDRNALQGEDVYRRAEELTDEIRRRQAEAERPEAERDYLGRLLDQF